MKTITQKLPITQLLTAACLSVAMAVGGCAVDRQISSTESPDGAKADYRGMNTTYKWERDIAVGAKQKLVYKVKNDGGSLAIKVKQQGKGVLVSEVLSADKTDTLELTNANGPGKVTVTLKGKQATGGFEILCIGD